MLIVEVNVVGHRFTGRVPDLRRRLETHRLPLTSRLIGWRPAQFRQPRAAA